MSPYRENAPPPLAVGDTVELREPEGWADNGGTPFPRGSHEVIAIGENGWVTVTGGGSYNPDCVRRVADDRSADR